MPGVTPPYLKLFEYLAKMGPALPANPCWRADLFPGRMVEVMLVVVVLVLRVGMGRVTAKDRPGRVARDTRVILAVTEPDPGAAAAFHDLQAHFSVKKHIMHAGKPTLERDRSRPLLAISGDDCMQLIRHNESFIDTSLNLALVDEEVVAEFVPVEP